jgi:hypothetical protein
VLVPDLKSRCQPPVASGGHEFGVGGLSLRAHPYGGGDRVRTLGSCFFAFSIAPAWVWCQ